jgi:hypothetical protein
MRRPAVTKFIATVSRRFICLISRKLFDPFRVAAFARRRHLIGCALVRRSHVKQVPAVGSIAEAQGFLEELGSAFAVVAGAAGGAALQ